MGIYKQCKELTYYFRCTLTPMFNYQYFSSGRTSSTITVTCLAVKAHCIYVDIVHDGCTALSTKPATVYGALICVGIIVCSPMVWFA